MVYHFYMKRTYTKWNEDQIAILKDNWTKLTISELSQLLSMSKSVVRSKAHSLKLPIKPKELSYKDAQSTNIERLLDGSIESWYWLGFITADGTFGKDQDIIILSITDEDAAQRFATFISSKVSTTQRSLQNKKWSDTYTVTGGNYTAVPLIRKVLNLPTSGAKTYNPPSCLPVLNSDQFFAFFAGFIDGDGMFANQGGNNSGRSDKELRIKLFHTWLPFLLELETRLYEELVLNRIPKSKINNQGYAQLRIQNFKIVKSLQDKVLKLDIPTLERKWRF